MAESSLLVDSPIGRLRLTARDGALVALTIGCPEEPQATSDHDPLLDDWADQIAAYFAGERRSFDIPLAPAGTPYQQKIWQALSAIPLGETRSYGDLARELASEARAIGFGCKTNPIPLVIPCHRVLAAGGAIGGFSGGEGLPTKRFLLALEGALPEAAGDRQGDLFAAQG